MNKTLLIAYLVIVAIFLSILIFANPSDMMQMILGGMIVIITSIYTYSTRRKQ